ncbi:MAG: nickel-dependent lactate racemase [Acidobacteria bacterium]|nr:nickel-dependent lactate racemase [Acidobacteriota bacterium]
MAIHRLPYGHGFLECDLAPAAAMGHSVETIEPAAAAPAADPAAEVEAALQAVSLPEYRGGGCAIAVNDRTRPVPHDVLLPPLLRRLERAGVPPDDVLIVIATGTHPVTPETQFREVVPLDILRRYRVVSHDARDEGGLAFLGTTSRGTPVWVNRAYLERELRVVVGVIEPHQFVGFSGGVKSASIGLAGYATVGHNHSMMSHPLSQLGRYDDNPCRQDIEDIGARIGIHLALNVILGDGKRIIRALAGPPVDVMRAGIPLVRGINQVEVDAPFDLMIVSPGGHPKDVNVYQAQKALAHAALVTRPGGTILLAAACPDGTGSQAYDDWMRHPDMTSHAAVIERFAREGYHIGPHKAFQISRDASRFTVLLHSAMAPAFVARLLLDPIPDVQAAIARAIAELQPGSRIGVMPRANATIPVLRGARSGS